MPLTLISIATGVYLKFWCDLVDSIFNLDANPDFRFVLLTDNLGEASKYVLKRPSLKVEVRQIPPYGWPEATLLRYKLMIENIKYQAGQLYVYIDADMLVSDVNNFVKLICKAGSNMNFVQHPGYYRPNNKWDFYRKNPKYMLKDIMLIWRMGGLGTWENRKYSTAFVPRKKRKVYCCGGIWFGYGENFNDFLVEMNRNVALDLDQGIVATWHDESHLNKYVSKNQVHIFSPSLCFASGMPQLANEEKVVLAVEKSFKERF